MKVRKGVLVMSIVRLSSKGQLVLPKKIREHLGLKPGEQLKGDLIGGRIILEPVEPLTETDWHRWKGALKGDQALQGHLEEHRLEVVGDDQGI